jgi:hypothetical protein
MWPDVPVIVATSDSLLKGETAHGLLEPAYAILDKPFDRSDLLTTVRAAALGLPKQPFDIQASFQAFA